MGTKFSRRSLLGAAGAAGAGLYVDRAAGVAQAAKAAASSEKHVAGENVIVPCHGEHQAGVTTPQQAHLMMASYTLFSSSRADLIKLLKIWQKAIERLTIGEAVSSAARISKPFPTAAQLKKAPIDTGESIEHGPGRLTITIGFGTSLFDHRFGLASQRPAALADIPAFHGDELDKGHSGGDISLQVCGENRLVVQHAVRDLTRIGGKLATLKWIQDGFTEPTAVTGRKNPRNLLGFKDGTANLDPTDAAKMASNVWASAEDGAPWMAAGSYQVFRRILLLLNVWDGSTLREQEDTFGRYKISGAPYGTTHEFDKVDLSRIPRLSHIKLANPRTGDSSEKERILRRGYNYHHGYKATGGLYDCGLAFFAYQRDPRKQFVPIQKRLAPHDELNRYLIHTASGLFAVPPGTKPGGYVGETLLES